MHFYKPSVEFLILLKCINRNYNIEQKLKGEPLENMTEFLGGTRFWFESFQNWQSEFFSIAAMVWLAVYLRQRGSPESKPVHSSYDSHD